MILGPVNPEGSDAIRSIANGVRATTSVNAMTLPPPISQPKDVSPPSPQAPQPPETNEVLMDPVNLLRQQSDRLELMPLMMNSTSKRQTVRRSRGENVVSSGDVGVYSPGDGRKDGDIVVCSRYAIDSGKRIGGENRHRQCVDDHDCYKIFSCPREIAFNVEFVRRQANAVAHVLAREVMF
ncbi:hypothetical protein MTR_6g038570 [Medicago truncatula]|uniref:Uncharacterized protein n=1 Tax=Medicago truncatula TaxID=3880 RepID=A0A072U886_MEDTR|nr:hypothetical protein MTR_6g038570 [Medicago truncatula]